VPTPEIRRTVDQRLHELYERHLPLEHGSLVRYYQPGRGYYAPESAGQEARQFAVSLVTADGELHEAGDHEVPFALQSVSKVLAYALALEDHGRDEVLRRVGVEPSGEAFNSIAFDEHNRRPFNPMVNAGALVTTDLIRGKNPEEKLGRILTRLRRWADNPSLEVDRDIFERELRTGDRNHAIAYLMRSQGMIAGDVEAVLALYLQQCSITVTCRDLAVVAATLANGGVNPLTDEAKSGVSGAILAVIPRKLGIGVFSPGLDQFGNSVRGVRVCEEISERLSLHVFATEAEDAMLGLA